MDADLYEHLNTTVTQSSTSKELPSSPSLSSSTDRLTNEEKPTSHSNDHQPADITRDTAPTSINAQSRVRTTSVNLPEEIDQVVSAIAASPWASKLNSLVGSVRKQVTKTLPSTVSLIFMSLPPV
jgi:hypothetical protein